MSVAVADKVASPADASRDSLADHEVQAMAAGLFGDFAEDAFDEDPEMDEQWIAELGERFFKRHAQLDYRPLKAGAEVSGAVRLRLLSGRQ